MRRPIESALLPRGQWRDAHGGPVRLLAMPKRRQRRTLAGIARDYFAMVRP